MTNKKILIVHLANGLGLHFFDWSLNFLCDNSVLDNPISFGHAHKHQLKIVKSHSDLTKYSIDDSKILVLQSMCTMQSFASQRFEDILTHKGREKIKIEVRDTHLEIIQTALKQEFCVVVVDWAQKHWLIPSYQKRFNTAFLTGEQITREEANTEWLNLFFSDAEEKWTQKTLWDQREMLAVCMRPKTLAETMAVEIKNKFGSSVDYITTDLLWYNLDHVVSKYIKIVPDKMHQWSKVYDQWKLVHDVEFSQDYKLICKDIVSNTYRDLQRYHLDFTKEALIQHGMIYAYNLNFKTWGLEKFSNNTRDLHRLLEPNIHPRQFSYVDFL